MKNWKLCLALTMAMLAPVLAGQQKAAADVEVQLKAAMQKELVDGYLKGAIELYQTIVAGAGGSRAVEAKALLAMGQCYEKLGSAEAQKAYERVERELPIRRRRPSKRGRAWCRSGGSPFHPPGSSPGRSGPDPK